MQDFDFERYVDRFKERLNRMVKPRRFIGLAIEDDAILAADVSREKDRFLVSKTGCFVFPEGVSFKDPAGLGKALGSFLQENGFSARKAVIGIPAKWLMIREKIIPASTKETIAGILRIHAEREFSLGPDELALDYCGALTNGGPNRLFLSAMLRKNLDRIILAVHSAGLVALSVTVSSVALFSRVGAAMFPPAPRFFLYLRRDYGEVVVRDGELTVDVRHIHKDIKKETGGFIAELRRILSNYSNNSLKEGDEQLFIWNGASEGLSSELKALSEALPTRIKSVEGNRHSIADRLDLPEGEEGEMFIAPVMLAGPINYSDPFYIDFLNSHMNIKPSVIKRNQVFWASAAALCVVIILLAMLFIWRADKKEVAELSETLGRMEEDITAAKDIIQKVNMAGGWYSERPRVLDCLRALTMAFPEEGNIWVTNLALTEEMKGVVSGRADGEKSVLDIMDQLKANELFSDVQMIYLQDSSSHSQEVSFSMNFSYTGKE